MAAPFFSAYSYTYSDYSSNNGSIINIQVTGGVPNVLVNISGPNGYNQNYIAPAIPDQLNLEPGTYTLSVVDGVGEVGDDVIIVIEEKSETILTANISDACNCPDCQCVVTISDYIHNSNCFLYNLYDGDNPTPVATFQGCAGQEYYQFTGLCTGDYRVEAIELDTILYTYGADTGDCTPGDLIFDETSDINLIVANWTRFCFLGNTTISSLNNGTLPSGLQPDGTITNAVGTYFERGVAWDKGDFNVPMTEGQDVGPTGLPFGLPYVEGDYYFNTAINKYIVALGTSGAGANVKWMTYDPKANTGLATGNPTATVSLTTSSQWNVNPLTATQVTIDATNVVVQASAKDTFPFMIECIQNSSIVNGFYSGCNFNNYVHEVTIGSTSNDNDEIGIILGAVKDVDGLYGPVDVTYTLQLIISGSAIRVAYNFGTNAYALDPVAVPGNLVVRDAVNPISGNWNINGNIRFKVVKTGSLIEIFHTDTMGASGNVPLGGSNPYNGTPIYSFDLIDFNTWHVDFRNEAIATNNEDILEKFLTNIKIGYSTASQPNTQFFDVAFNGEVVVAIIEEPIEGEYAIDEVTLDEPCELCYLATNCLDPQDTVLVTLPANQPALDTSVTYVFNEFPDKCWTIEPSDLCGGTAGSTILLNTGFIDAANNLGVEDQPDFNWNVVQGDVPVPTPAIITDQSIPGYGSLFNALWINQLIAPHLIGISQPTIYEKTFVLPPSFTPQLVLDLLSEIRAVVTLNGFIIGDNNNPVTYPDPLGTPANFSTSNPIHFNANPAVNTLRVEINVHGEERNGFALAGNITSQGQLLESTPVTIQEIFVDCTECLGVCYELIDCQGLLSPIQTDTDLSAYVGQVITILTCPDTCWTVFEMDACPLNPVAVYLKDSFADCVSCLPAAPAPEPLVIRNRTVKPGYDTKGCSPEYVEKISCEWSEALFQQAAAKRYGIEFCCKIDLDALDIKKQLMDFKMITDPEACATIASQCCPPCNVEASLVVFAPVACPVPNLVSAILVPPPRILGKDCRQVRFFVKEGARKTPAIFDGVTCDGSEIHIELSIGETFNACIDVNQPFTANSYMGGTVIGTCS